MKNVMFYTRINGCERLSFDADWVLKQNKKEGKMDITDLINNERAQTQTCAKCGKKFYTIEEDLCEKCYKEITKQLKKEADEWMKRRWI